MSSSHGGRRRPLTRASSASEDQALNQIAREAESRLAAKRAARAEARSIRLKELEREHKEAQEELERQQQGNNDQDTTNKKAAVSRSISTGGISNRVKEEAPEINGPALPEKVLKSMQENLHQIEEKYRKAMVSIAQLDNEKQALLYQVDCFKDRLVEEEEVCSELKSENQQQTRESERLKKRIKEQDEEIEKLREAVQFRDNFLSERGLSLSEEAELPESDECDARSLSQIKDALTLAVPDDSSSDRGSGSRSRSGSRRPSLSDEKDVLVNQIKTLQEQVATLRRADVEPPQTITADLEELRREFSRQINDFKIKQQKAEQDNARLEGLVMRLESQVKRYKTQAEASEATEDSLKAEKRKLQRELRKAQDEKGELETVNDHLQKRLEKLKIKRKDEA